MFGVPSHLKPIYWNQRAHCLAGHIGEPGSPLLSGSPPSFPATLGPKAKHKYPPPPEDVFLNCLIVPVNIAQRCI